MPPVTMPAQRQAIHPLAAFLLAGSLPLFLGALLADWAYVRSPEVQWINFAAWLNAGATAMAGFAVLATGLDALFRRRRSRIAFGLIAATFAVGFIAALVHTRDAYASMPGGLVLSLFAFLLALAAVIAGFIRTGGETL